MSELRDLLDREARRIQGGNDALGSVMRRVQRKRRTRRAATGALALIIAAVGGFGAYRAFRPRPVETGVGRAGTSQVFEGIWPETAPEELRAAQRSIDDGHQPWRTDPVETARAFATNVMQWQDDQVQAKIIGSDDPTAILVQLVNGDRPSDTGLADADLATFVTLEQLGREGGQGIWSVVAAHGGFVEVSWPEEGAVLVPGDPFEIGGTVSYSPAGATLEAGLFAGEGGVPFVGEGSLAVRRIEGTENGFFGELGPVPKDRDGSVILVALARDGTGSIIGAAARRVRVATASTRQVLVFFSYDPNDPAVVRPVPRLVPTTADPLEEALRELLRGPTDEERAQGLSSPFSRDSADSLNFASVKDGLATVDLQDLSSVIPGTSAVALGLNAQLNATVFQFTRVNAVRYQINGNCEAFSTFMNGLDTCPTITEGQPTSLPTPVPGLPPDVEAKRDAILDAAAGRRYEALRRLSSADNFTFSYGGGRDPVAFWKELEKQGENPLHTLQVLMTMPFAVDESGIYVWPSFFTSDPNHFTEAELRLARKIATEEEIRSWKEYGSYLGYRVGIEADSDWIFFVAGD